MLNDRWGGNNSLGFALYLFESWFATSPVKQKGVKGFQKKPKHVPPLQLKQRYDPKHQTKQSKVH
jgi:hypothetical protein